MRRNKSPALGPAESDRKSSGSAGLVAKLVADRFRRTGERKSN